MRWAFYWGCYMTSRVDFQQVLLNALAEIKAKEKEDERKEVFAVVGRLASEMEVATDGQLKIWVPSGELGDESLGAAGYRCFRINLKKTGAGGEQKLMRVETLTGGYPFSVIYKSSVNSQVNKVKDVNNKEELECALVEMLKSSAATELIYSLMNEQRTGDGD
jgi:hypothetical protein